VPTSSNGSKSPAGNGESAAASKSLNLVPPPSVAKSVNGSDKIVSPPPPLCQPLPPPTHLPLPIESVVLNGLGSLDLDGGSIGVGGKAFSITRPLTAASAKDEEDSAAVASEDGLVIITIIPDEKSRFGFNVKGGADQKMPIIVSRVGANTPADR
jgi:hypothetical protein